MNPLLASLRRAAGASALLAASLVGRKPAWAVRALEEGTAPLPNAPLPTLGGLQLWCDERFFQGWRIQRNVYSGHYRLLDPSSVRRAWGRRDECEAALERVREHRALKPMHGKAVIVLHGLLSTPLRMRSISRFLQEQGGYTVFNMTYPTTRRPIAEHARALDQVIRNLEGIDEINFVGHSLGNIVVRHYLADQAATPEGVDPRIHRLVMLGPPNAGSAVATWFQGRRLLKHVFRLATGESGAQLGTNWSELAPRLATPPCEFGVIAGGKGGEIGYNRYLPGDNDFLVTVESARLAGARDFVLRPARHAVMMYPREIQEMTLRFLQHGYFISEEARQPVLAPSECEVPTPSERAVV